MIANHRNAKGKKGETVRAPKKFSLDEEDIFFFFVLVTFAPFFRLSRDEQAQRALSRLLWNHAPLPRKADDDNCYRNRGRARKHGTKRRREDTRSSRRLWRRWKSTAPDCSRRVSLLGAPRVVRRNAARGGAQGEGQGHREGSSAGGEACARGDGGGRRSKEPRRFFAQFLSPKKKTRRHGPSRRRRARSRPWPPSSRRTPATTW